MIIYRRISKEVLVTSISISAIILFVFIANSFLKHFMHVANGDYPLGYIFQIMGYELPNLLTIFIPFGD